MADRENVINGLKLLAHWPDGLIITDKEKWIKPCCEMAVALLKEQEPKTGHWIESKCLDDCFWVCSECDFPSEALAAPKLYKYCPNCGTKMEGQQ